MKKSLVIAFAATLSTLSVQAMAADGEGTIRAKAIYGTGTYALDLTRTITADMPIVGLGVAYVGSGNGFIDVQYRKSGSSAEHDGYTAKKEAFEHNDWTLTVGTTTDAGLQMFVGLTQSVNTLKHTPTVTSTWTKDELTTTGYFLGLAHSWKLGETGKFGAISLNGSFGGMNGKWKEDTTTPFNEEGTALGYGYGIGYQLFLTKNIGLGADYKQQRYNWTMISPSVKDFKEKITFKTLSLFGQF